MQLYDATVRLEGSIGHEVPKTGLTAAEILCIRAAQKADDAVVNIQPKDTNNRSKAVEYKRLAEAYGLEIVKDLFGGEFNPDIPDRLPDGVLDTPAGEDVRENVKNRNKNKQAAAA